MVERLLTIIDDELKVDGDKNNLLGKGQSFNTDDDDGSMVAGDSQQISDAESKTTHSNAASSRLDNLKRGLLGLHSPSIDSINDVDGPTSDTPTSEKTKKKKQRRITEQLNNGEIKKPIIKSHPWYTKVDLTKPLISVAILFLLYCMWVKRDVWIPRLLTSNSRIRHIALAHEEKASGKADLPSTIPSNNSTSLPSNQDEIADDNDNKNIDQTTSTNNNEESSTTPTSKQSTQQKLNIRVRRNKMSFSKERGGKRHHHHHLHKTTDDDADIDDDDEDDVDDDDVDVHDNADNRESPESDHDETDTETVKEKPPILSSSVHSSKKTRNHHHHQPEISHKKKSKTLPSSKTGLTLSSRDDIVEQLQKLIKTRSRNGDFQTLLTKKTGLKKSEINKFIYKKDFSIMTVETLISFLNSYDLSLLIVPQ